MCSSMDATRDYHSEVIQKENKTPYYITYMWNLKYDPNEPIYYRTDLCLPRGRESGEGRIGRVGLADANYYVQDR